MSHDQVRIIKVSLILGMPLIGFLLLTDDSYYGWRFFASMIFQMGSILVLLLLGILEIVLMFRHVGNRIGKYWIYVSALFLVITIFGFTIGRTSSQSPVPEIIWNLNPVFWWPERITLSYGMPWDTYGSVRHSWVAFAHVVVYWELISLGIVTLGYMLVSIVNTIRNSKYGNP